MYFKNEWTQSLPPLVHHCYAGGYLRKYYISDSTWRHKYNTYKRIIGTEL